MHRMRPFGELLSKEEALARILAAAAPTERVEVVSLLAARGRASAEDARAEVAVPPFARATMDGYALRAGDGLAPRRVVAEAFAGKPVSRAIGPGQAARIATGAPVPEGADAVVRVEDASEEAGHVALRVAPRPGQCIDPAGSDVAPGGPIVARGDVLTPARLGLLASVGRASARVFARPRVAILSTGDELLAPGEPPRPGAIYDSNSTSLAALLEGGGAEVRLASRLADDLDAQSRALVGAAAASDLVVTSGGASVGARDLVVDAVRRHGEVVVHGVRVKPGKPLLVGRVGRALVVGLPGNPTSALSDAALFVLPLVRRLAGLPAPWERVVEARMAERVEGDPKRFLFLPVRLDGGLARSTFKGSGALTSLAESDGWVGVREGETLEAGAPVRVALWEASR